MAKGAYFGTSSKARKIKKIYFGVGGVARKVVRGYFGINNIAKLFWRPFSFVTAGTNITDSLINANSSSRYIGCNLSNGNGLLYINPGTSSSTTGHWNVLAASGVNLKIDSTPLINISWFTDCYQDIRLGNLIFHYWENTNASIVFVLDVYNESFTKLSRPIDTDDASNSNPGYFSLAQTTNRVYLFGGYYSSSRYRGSSKVRVLNSSGTEETAITGLSYTSCRYYGTSVSFGDFVMSTGMSAGYCTITDAGTSSYASFSSVNWTSMRAEDSGYSMSAAPYNDFGNITGAVFKWNDYTNYNTLSRVAHISHGLTQTILNEDSNAYGHGSAPAWIEGAVIFAGGGRSYSTAGDCTDAVEVYNETMTLSYSTPLGKAASQMGSCFAPVNDCVAFAQGRGPGYTSSDSADKTIYVYRSTVV